MSPPALITKKLAARSSASENSEQTKYSKYPGILLPPCASPILNSESGAGGPVGSEVDTANTCSDLGLPIVHNSGSSTDLDPNNPSTTTGTCSRPSTPVPSNKPAPIWIPPPTLTWRDINRVPTPLSGRGDRKGHLFPFSRSPSPRALSITSQGKRRRHSNDSDLFFGQLERTRSASPASSASSKSHHGSLAMHNEAVNTSRYPTSPLSPNPSAKQSLSPRNPQWRGNHGRQSSRNAQLNFGRYHPSHFAQGDAVGLGGPSAVQAPQITYTRAAPAVQAESPRLLRDKHREFLEKAKLSSKLAASPLSIKPGAPRLDPLGSPIGAVTPLELEQTSDYFSGAGAGKISPAGSPGGSGRGNRSPREHSPATKPH